MMNSLRIILLVPLIVGLGYSHATPLDSIRRNSSSSAESSDDMNSDWAHLIMRLSKAADISAMLNTKVDPCSDFYTYACGNWHRSNPAQLLNDIMTDKFQQMAKTFDHRLEAVLGEVRIREGLEKKASDFHKACLTVESDKSLYREELKTIPQEFGGMPVLMKAGGDGEESGGLWKEEEFSWWQTVAKINNKYGVDILFAVDIMGDIKDNKVNRVYLGPPDFNMIESSRLMDLVQEATIHKYLTEYFGVDSKVAKTTAKELVAFESEVMKGSTDARSGLGLKDLISEYSVAELQEHFNTTLDVPQYLEMVLGMAPPEKVYVYDEKYLVHLLALMEHKPKRIVANYVMWQLIDEYIVQPDKGLDKFCLGQTKKYFGKYIDHLVYSRYRSEELEAAVMELWEEIRSTFRDDLRGDKLDWISNSTREYAIEKLDLMELSINSYDNEDFSQEYGDIDVDPLMYVNNVQQLLMQESRRSLAKWNQTGSSIEATEILSFTPAYNVLENKIQIPVALMQPRFFWDLSYPNALKYATMGYLIAHEMMHGFDDDGRKYDKNGNVDDWWDPKSMYEFEARRKCFQAQYHEYKYGGAKLPDSISQSENIADNAGVKIAFKAYLRWLERRRRDQPDIDKKEVFPGLQFNNKQLFFISFAQVWCEDVQTLFRKTVASGDTHAPGMYRVIGSLSNYQEFSWIFSCKPDSPMDPDYKCSIY